MTNPVQLFLPGIYPDSDRLAGSKDQEAAPVACRAKFERSESRATLTYILPPRAVAPYVALCGPTRTLE